MEWKEIMTHIDEAIEALAVSRKAAIDNGIDIEMVDEYISNQAQKMFAKIEKMNDAQMVMLLLGKIVESAGDLGEIMAEIKDMEEEE